MVDIRCDNGSLPSISESNVGYMGQSMVGLVTRTRVFGLYYLARLNLPAEMQRLARIVTFSCHKLSYYAFHEANNKGAYQTARVMFDLV